MNNLDFFLTRDLMQRLMKAQFEEASQESLTPVNREHPGSPEIKREKRSWFKNRAWTYKSNSPEPEQH